jgi:hypothetical protein
MSVQLFTLLIRALRLGMVKITVPSDNPLNNCEHSANRHTWHSRPAEFDSPTTPSATRGQSQIPYVTEGVSK